MVLIAYDDDTATARPPHIEYQYRPRREWDCSKENNTNFFCCLGQIVPLYRIGLIQTIHLVDLPDVLDVFFPVFISRFYISNICFYTLSQLLKFLPLMSFRLLRYRPKRCCAACVVNRKRKLSFISFCSFKVCPRAKMERVELHRCRNNRVSNVSSSLRVESHQTPNDGKWYQLPAPSSARIRAAFTDDT